MAPDLSSSWREFASGPAKLVLRENLKGVDPGFLTHVEKLKMSFAHDKNLANYLTPPVNMTSEREVQWAESRQCLVDVLNSFKDKTSKIHVSISHTQTCSVAVGCQGVAINGVGIDIERADREITPKAAAKFILQEELNLNLKPLEFWVLKEAAFKSDLKRQPKVISQYQLLSFDEISGEGSVVMILDKDLLIKVKLINQDSLVVGFALA